jgi:DNA-binding response OmpR family regulator
VIGRQPSILITDDDRNFREAIRDVLEPHGFRTLLARDGEEALSILRVAPIHIVLTDMHMPRLTGLEMIRRVHQMRGLLPCILMSAEADDTLVREAQEAQAFTVLPKPISGRAILNTVGFALRRNYGWRCLPQS